MANVDTTHYLLGTVAGPHPFPVMVRDFVRGIGVEARAQCLDLTRAAARRGLRLRRRRLERDRASSTRSSPTPRCALYGFEAGGDGVDTGRHAASITGGRGRGAARQPDLRAAGRGRPDHRVALDLGRSGLPRGRAGARLAARHRPGALRAGRPTPRRWRRSRCCAAPRGSSRRSRARTRWPARCAAGRSRTLGPPATILVNLSGRGDKDVETAGAWFGVLSDGRPDAGAG